MSDETKGDLEPVQEGAGGFFAIMERMAAKGTSPDVLRQMMDLKDRWDANASKKAYTEAMKAAQAEMPTVIRDAANSHTKSLYAKLETVALAIKPVYTTHGFTLSFAEAECPKENHGRITCQVRHIGGHIEPFWGDFPNDGAGAKGGGNMSAIQGKVSTYTYARRCLTCAIFDIVIADEDQDGNSPLDPLNPMEFKVVNDLMAACKRAGNPVDMARFLAWVSESAKHPIQRLAEVPHQEFAKMVDFLNRKRDEKKEAPK